ncbi:MAG: gliding motility-associated C-terminal domain-containing protein, partial [Hymenobacter sp.]
GGRENAVAPAVEHAHGVLRILLDKLNLPGVVAAIRIPNAFTPNGDGRDDTWQIEFIEQYPENTVSVFNRWGNRVFSATNYSRANEWRGDMNGQPAPVGTYYYVVVTKGPLGRSYSGSLTILY